MRTQTLLLLAGAGVGGYFLYKHYYPTSSAAASTTGRYVDALGYNGNGGGYAPQWPPQQWPPPWRHRRAQNAGLSPWDYRSTEYGQPGGGAYGWTPYSRAAAYGPSPVEMESPGSISYLASQIDAGF